MTWLERIALAVGRAPAIQPGEVTERLAALRGDAPVAHPVEPVRWPKLGLVTDAPTAREVHRFASRVAAALRGPPVRLEPGERVAVLVRNHVDFAWLCWAVWRAGGVCVPLSDRLRPDEVGHALRDCGAVMAIVDQSTLSACTGDLAAHAGVRAWLSADGSPPGFMPGRPVWDLDRLAAEAPSAGVEAPAPRVAPGETAAVFYTSGTTGLPKGAMLAGEGLCRMIGPAVAMPAERVGGGRPVLVLEALPLSHIYGFTVALLGAFAGITLRHHARFRAADFLDDVERARPVAVAGVPAMYQALLDAGAAGRQWSSVRVFVNGADAIPGDLMATFKRLGAWARLGPLRVPAAFIDGYGMVETTGAALLRVSLPGLDVFDRDGFWGVPLPGVSTRVVREDGRDAAPGEVGELWLRAPGVLRGYLGREDDSRRAVTDGWLHTGDLAKRGRTGLVRFAGRARDVLKVGGFSVFPAEIEAKLAEHPAVRAAVVFGAPHRTQGEVPVAAVVLQDGTDVGEDELVRWTETRMASYKAPRRFLRVRMDELPLGLTGKVVRREARERFLPRLEEAR